MFRMSDSDSDSCDLVRVNSNKIKTHKFAPSDTEFKIKIKPLLTDKIGLLYVLKKGQDLPYSPELKGNTP